MPSDYIMPAMQASCIQANGLKTTNPALQFVRQGLLNNINGYSFINLVISLTVPSENLRK
jgi:hypothetical protein